MSWTAGFIRLACGLQLILLGQWSGALAGAGCGDAQALTIYTERGAWEAAVNGPLVNDDFEYSIFSTNPSITFESGVVSSTLSGDNSVGAGRHLGGVDINQPLTWSFPWPVFAFGFDVSSLWQGTNITGEFDGIGKQVINVGASFQLSTTGNYNSFIGIVGDSQFNAVIFEGYLSQDHFLVDNLAFTARPVPEPGTMILLSTGLVGLAGATRRRKG
ncbi:MAG: PEP-CTERM sorting domain-containing protein [Deferrisomatales bacterium]|nr:PEP-CTERM sorting domain-containing protein [Deferrisomatales bacterium]